MKYVRLGRTGLKVSRVCLGTNMFGAGYVDDDRATSVIHEAITQGVNFIDTADVYNAGLSEQVVGRAVEGRRHEVVIGTKGFAPMGSGVNDRGSSRKHLIEAVEASLKRLESDYIDLYQGPLLGPGDASGRDHQDARRPGPAGQDQVSWLLELRRLASGQGALGQRQAGPGAVRVGAAGL